AGVARLDGVADGGQFDVDQVPELLLGMVGDADGDLAVALHAHPLVGLHELQVAGDLAHFLLRVGYGWWEGVHKFSQAARTVIKRAPPACRRGRTGTSRS